MAKLERVGLDHPECCQGTTGQGGCEYRQSPGSLYCGIHAGGAAQKSAERAELRNYQLNSAYAKRASDMSKSSAVKNLTDEIALMRVALETVFNSINNPNEMLLYVDKIDKLANGIQKLIESWQKIQERNRELLGRETVLAIFDNLMEKICERVTDPDVIQALATDGYEIISKGMGE